MRGQKRPRFGEFAIVQLAANQNSRNNFVPRLAMAAIIEKRHLLAPQTRSKNEFCAQGQASAAFPENAGAEPEVPASDNSQRDGWPKEQAAPRPKQSRQNTRD